MFGSFSAYLQTTLKTVSISLLTVLQIMLVKSKFFGFSVCFLSFLLMGAKTANAQWATYGTNIANTNTGNVGIGTSAPVGLLNIDKWSGIYEAIRIGNPNNNNADKGAKIRFDQANTESGHITNSYSYSLGSWGMGFATGWTTSDMLTIRGNGNVGVGVVNPLYKLHINGDGYFNGNATINNILTLKTLPAWSDNNKVLMVGSSGMVGTVDTTNWDKNASDDVTGLINTYGLSIGTSGTMKLVGLNPTAVTSTTWGSGSPFTWTFNGGTAQPGLTFDNGSVTVNNASLNVNGAVKMNSGTRPACTDALRGTMWFVKMGLGTTEKDSFAVCAQDNNGTSDWRTLY